MRDSTIRSQWGPSSGTVYELLRVSGTEIGMVILKAC